MKKVIPLALLTLISTTSFADGILDTSTDVVGDAYLRKASDYNIGTIKQTRYDLKDISASSLEKTVKQKKKSEISQIRYETLRNAALDFGASAGLSNAADIINKRLDLYNKKGKRLDVVFNFTKLELEPGFIPPVISEARDAYNQPNENEVRAADKIYRIEIPARIANAAPDWRDYLYVDSMEPNLPVESYLPKTAAEKEVWDEWVQKGWQDGNENAQELYDNGLSRLKRDFLGMIRFKKLYELGMVTKPKLSKTELGVTGGGKEMAIGDRVIKKTKDAELKANKWFK